MTLDLWAAFLDVAHPLIGELLCGSFALYVALVAESWTRAYDPELLTSSRNLFIVFAFVGVIYAIRFYTMGIGEFQWYPGSRYHEVAPPCDFMPHLLEYCNV